MDRLGNMGVMQPLYGVEHRRIAIVDKPEVLVWPDRPPELG
jgi:hypothetical protein